MLTTKKLAEELHVTAGTVRLYARRGLIPFVETPSGHRRYDLEDVQTALARSRARRFEAADAPEHGPSLAAMTNGPPLRPARGWRPTITVALIAGAREGESVARLQRELRQGDVLDVAKSVTLFSPDAPSYPSETAGAPHDDPVMTMETLLKTGLSVVLSQDCDLRRPPAIEPYVVLAPLSEVDERTYREASDGMSSRFFAYPVIEGREDKGGLVVDARVVFSLEKTALMSSHIKRLTCPLSAPRREQLRNWLGNRFGRPAFPDEVVRQVVEPVASALKRVRGRDGFAGFFASVAFTGLAWTPGQAYCSLMLLTDPSLRERHGVSDTDVRAVHGRLCKALDHFARESDYTVIANIHDVTERPATDVLSHYEIDLDLDALDL